MRDVNGSGDSTKSKQHPGDEVKSCPQRLQVVKGEETTEENHPWLVADHQTADENQPHFVADHQTTEENKPYSSWQSVRRHHMATVIMGFLSDNSVISVYVFVLLLWRN